jgi:hypothetical protein
VAVPATVLPILFILRAPDALFTRLTVAAAMMVFCGLNIHQAPGFFVQRIGRCHSLQSTWSPGSTDAKKKELL